MSKLRLPLDNEFTDSISEEQVQRIWAGIQHHRVRRSVRLHRKSLAVVSLVGVIAIALAWFWPPIARSGGPLLLKDGRQVTTLGGDRPQVIEFSDGSRVELGPGAELELLENSAHTFVSVLRRAKVVFDVRPGGARRWTIEAGLVSVEVVGTRFEVNRLDDAVEVEVMRGAVLVRGERVPDRVERVVAGSRLVVRGGTGSTTTLERSTEAPSASVADDVDSSLVLTPKSPAKEAKAGAVLQNIDELLALADAKRRSGDGAGAQAVLRRILTLHAGERRAALAAFTLGRLLFETRPSEAALAFSKCLSLSPPEALAEDALARLVEAEAASGHPLRARAAFEDYQRRYPSGRWLRAVKQWAKEN
jgi:transmembrane sensor